MRYVRSSQYDAYPGGPRGMRPGATGNMGGFEGEFTFTEDGMPLFNGVPPRGGNWGLDIRRMGLQRQRQIEREMNDDMSESGAQTPTGGAEDDAYTAEEQEILRGRRERLRQEIEEHPERFGGESAFNARFRNGRRNNRILAELAGMRDGMDERDGYFTLGGGGTSAAGGVGGMRGGQSHLDIAGNMVMGFNPDGGLRLAGGRYVLGMGRRRRF